jgi:hypothetical protein
VAAGDKVFAGAARAYDDLARVCLPLIGQVGVAALTARAVHLAQREHSWLVDAGAPASTTEPFVPVLARLAEQDSAVATDGVAAVLAMLVELLITFIGESLTAGLLREAWPEAFSEAQAEE